MSISIRQLAKIAGVSPTTISLALRDSPKISKKTRERIQRLAAQENCRTNLLARGFFEGRSYSIGVIIPSVANVFYPPIIQGIEDQAISGGYAISIGNSYNSLEREKLLIEMFLQRRVDGLIISPVYDQVDEAHFRKIHRSRVPVLIIDRRLERVETDFVGSDDYTGAYRAAQYLISLGHTRIAYIGGPDDIWTAHRRRQGYTDALSDHGISVPDGYILELPFADDSSSLYHSSVTDAVTRLFEREVKPTAISTVTDIAALGVYDTLDRLGYKIPNDVSVIGFGDLVMCDLMRPRLTTVVQPKRELGRIAASILIDRIDERTREREYHGYQTICLDVELKVRESTSPLAGS